MEEELKASEKLWETEKAGLVDELSRLLDDNERQQKLLSSNLTKSPQDQNEAFLRHEIVKLTQENLRLYEEKVRLLEQVQNVNDHPKVARHYDGIGKTSFLLPFQTIF